MASKNKELSQISVGYLNNEKENNYIFHVDSYGVKWARSGDKVKINDDDTFISHYKNILTYNGFNINCDKLTELVLKEPYVSNAVVFGCNTSDENQMPVICIESSISEDEQLIIRDNILNKISSKYPDYYMPKDIVFYDKFPVISMKIDIQTIKKELLNDCGEYIEKSYKKLKKYNLNV